MHVDGEFSVGRLYHDPDISDAGFHDLHVKVEAAVMKHPVPHIESLAVVRLGGLSSL